MRARRDRLVLFLGAGASVGAGVPSWKGLLDRLRDQAGMDASAMDELLAPGPRDAGMVLDRRLRREGLSLADASAQVVASEPP